MRGRMEVIVKGCTERGKEGREFEGDKYKTTE